MMSLSSTTRRWFSRGTISALVAASLVAIASPAHAVGIGEVTPERFIFDRISADGTSVVVKDGEEANLVSRTIFDTDYAGFPFAKDSVLSRTGFTVTAPSGTEIGDEWREWWGNRQEAGESLCNEVYENTPKLTITKNSKCINFLQVVDTASTSNDTGSSKTFTTNAASQVIKNGKKTIANAEDNELLAQVTKRDATSHTIASDEDNLIMDMKACIDESLISTDEQTLDVELIVKRDGTTLTLDEDYYVWQSDSSEYFSEDLTQYTSPGEIAFGGSLENLDVNLTVWMTSTEAATYTATLDVQNASNNSVLEECPVSNGSTFPTISIASGDNPSATGTDRDLPSEIELGNTNFDMYSYHQDGFGGLFYWNVGDSSASEYTANLPVTVVHMSSTGASSTFNGSGKFVSTTGNEGDFSMNRYDTDGSKWYSLVKRGKNWSMTSGSMTSGSPVTKTITAKALNKLCPTDFTAAQLWGDSSSTTVPTAQMWCTLGANHSMVLVNLSNVTKITTLGVTSRKNPCFMPSEGKSSLASNASDIAMVFYTRVSTKDSEGMCTTIGATTKSRSITTVTKAGVASTTALASSPWGAAGEPMIVELAPENSAGTSWIGIRESAVEGDFYGATVPDGSFSMSSSAISVNAGTDFDLGLEGSADNVSLTPIKKISGTKWLMGITNTYDFDGVSSVQYRVSTLNPSTGVVTNGDMGSISGFGDYITARIASSFSVKSGDSVNWYVLKDESQYKVTTWVAS